MKTTHLAKLAGLSARRINQLIAEKILPPTVAGEWPDADAVLSAMFYHLRNQNPSGARQRLEMAQARIAELKLKRARHEVVLLDRVMADWADVTLKFRQKILQIPGRIGSQLSDSAAAKIAEQVVGDALRELSREMFVSADQPHEKWELPDE
jgi:hypothetical protein